MRPWSEAVWPDTRLEHYKATPDLGMGLPCLLRTGQKGATRTPQHLTLSHGWTHSQGLLCGTWYLGGTEQYLDAG